MKGCGSSDKMQFPPRERITTYKKTISNKENDCDGVHEHSYGNRLNKNLLVFTRRHAGDNPGERKGNRRSRRRVCQLSKLLYRMAPHTPLTVVERHHRGYDVVSDFNLTQLFGSGSTCFYPYGGRMIRNDTDWEFQLCLRVEKENLSGECRSAQPPEERYELVEKSHRIRGEYWGGFTRHNELWRRVFGPEENSIREADIMENHVFMMYELFLSEKSD